MSCDVSELRDEHENKVFYGVFQLQRHDRAFLFLIFFLLAFLVIITILEMFKAFPGRGMKIYSSRKENIASIL